MFRVGDTRPETVDIRILAATNRDLEKEIANGRFREDLYYRLNVVNVELPPLRARGDDVLVVARYLLSRYSREYDTQGQRPVAERRGRDPQAQLARQYSRAREPHQEGDRAVRVDRDRARRPRPDG